LQRETDRLHAIEIRDDAPRDVQRMRIVLGEMIGHAGDVRKQFRNLSARFAVSREFEFRAHTREFLAL